MGRTFNEHLKNLRNFVTNNNGWTEIKRSSSFLQKQVKYLGFTKKSEVNGMRKKRVTDTKEPIQSQVKN